MVLGRSPNSGIVFVNCCHRSEYVDKVKAEGHGASTDPRPLEPGRKVRAMPKKVNVKQVLKDIKEGMHDSQLMYKYELSPGQLKNVYKKLQAAGLWEEAPPEPMMPAPEADEPEGVFVCPACGVPQPRPFDECPSCGIVTSKHEEKHKRPVGPYAADPDAKDADIPEIVRSQAAQTKGVGHLFRIAFVLAFIVLAVLAWIMFSGIDDSDQPSYFESGRTTRTDADPRDGSSEDRSKFKNVIDKKLPRVAPINENLNRHLKDEFGDLGDSLDKKRNRLLDESDE